MTAKQLKGVYNYNPTSMVMKQGSEAARGERSKPGATRIGQRNMHPGDSSADTRTDAGVETEVHHPAHPAMQTRHSHPKEIKHADGRKHEDMHHAVKQLKGQ